MCQALSPNSLSGSTDLEDMSVMVLRTQGPAALFDDHRLVLHTSSHDAKRAQVFHACGEFTATPCCQGPSFPCLGLVGRLCTGSALAPRLPRGRRARHVCPGAAQWASLAQPGPGLFYRTNEFFKYILSTFRKFCSPKFQTYTKVENERCNSPPPEATHSDRTTSTVHPSHSAHPSLLPEVFLSQSQAPRGCPRRIQRAPPGKKYNHHCFT